jgi:hypothetical protein
MEQTETIIFEDPRSMRSWRICRCQKWQKDGDHGSPIPCMSVITRSVRRAHDRP